MHDLVTAELQCQEGASRTPRRRPGNRGFRDVGSYQTALSVYAAVLAYNYHLLNRREGVTIFIKEIYIH